MKFDDFVEQTAAKTAKFRALGYPHPSALVPPFSNTKIFNLGEDEKVTEVAKSLPLADDCINGIPMPFKDISMFSMIKPPHDGWVCDRVIEVTNQKFLFIRVEEKSETAYEPLMIVWAGTFLGITEETGEKKYKYATSDKSFHDFPNFPPAALPALRNFIDSETLNILTTIPLISHPANYVVQVTPALTPKEERKISAKGTTPPARKTPYFIVIDHEVLVKKFSHGGTHASPIAHMRRGHWRRLGDFHKLAKAAGKEKVFVRPAHVGKTEVLEGTTRYKVLLDGFKC